MWSKGRTFITSTTRKWTQEEIAKNDQIEGLSIFSDFSIEDEGRSRKRVCTMEEHHPDFQINRQLILKAHELKQTLSNVNRMLDSGLEVHPDSPIHGHIKKLMSAFI